MNERIGRLVLAAVLACGGTASAGFLEDTKRAFQDSEIRAQRGGSLAPSIPLARVSTGYYGDTDVELTDGTRIEYDLVTVNQYAVLPMVASKRDVWLIGEYLSYSDFDVVDPAVKDFEVTTVGVPVGWLRQQSDNWQLAGFVVPMAHRSTLDGSGWNSQFVGGAFARYYQGDRLWWLFGLYASASPDDDFVIPYVGASWSVNAHWTVNAMLPRPSVQYAPDRNWLISLGVTQSDASWNVNPGGGDVGFNYDALDLNLGVERRIAGDFWLGARAGVGGVRGLRFSGSSFDWPDFDWGSNGFFALDIHFRPSVSRD